MNKPDELINDYVALCGTRTTMEDATNLPTRFRAVLAFQGDLSAFVLKYPKALSLGVDQMLEDAEREQVRATLQAFGVKYS